MTKESSGQ